MENKTGIREVVIEEIVELARNYGIGKVILFGSRARGDYKKTSDIDLAIKGGNRINFALDVEDVTSTLLKFDVIDLDGPVPDYILESIEEEGITIYEKV